jgi:hypothetical protein
MKHRFLLATAAISVAIFASAVWQAEPQSGSEGQAIFRFDTFGDEQLWTDTLRLQDATRMSARARL